MPPAPLVVPPPAEEPPLDLPPTDWLAPPAETPPVDASVPPVGDAPAVPPPPLELGPPAGVPPAEVPPAEVPPAEVPPVEAPPGDEPEAPPSSPVEGSSASEQASTKHENTVNPSQRIFDIVPEHSVLIPHSAKPTTGERRFLYHEFNFLRSAPDMDTGVSALFTRLAPCKVLFRNGSRTRIGTRRPARWPHDLRKRALSEQHVGCLGPRVRGGARWARRDREWISRFSATCEREHDEREKSTELACVGTAPRCCVTRPNSFGVQWLAPHAPVPGVVARSV
jgi:hypothetical protein